MKVDSQFQEQQDNEGKDKMIRHSVEKFLYQNQTGKSIEMFIGILSFISSLIFVVMSYFPDGASCWLSETNACKVTCDEQQAKFIQWDDYGGNQTEWKNLRIIYNFRTQKWFNISNIVICVIYLIEYLLKIFISQNRCQYFISRSSIIDLLIIIPNFVLSTDPYSTNKAGLYFQSQSYLIRMLKAGTLLRKSVIIGDTDVSRKIFSIVITAFILMYISAGLYMVIENLSVPICKQLPFHSTIYFIVVTLATVGYGDIYPKTDEGKMFTMSIIIFTIIMWIPQQTNELLRLMGLKSFYARKIYKSNQEIPHIVITGQVVLQALRNFCQELFHQDHGSQDRHAVIIQQTDPAVDMEMFLHDPNYEFFINYLNGNPITQKDLKRADTEKAKTCILLTNKNAIDATGVDHKNILIGLAIKKYVNDNNRQNPNMRLCMQLIKPESKQHYNSSLTNNSGSLDQIIIVEEIKMNLMSKSCFSPGLISLISNLIASSSDQSDMEEHWLEEYSEGMGHEIYRIQLSEKMENRYFSDIARTVYKKTKAIVFALEVKCNGKTIIRLNPSDFIVNNIEDNQIYVYTICPDKRTAESIETIEMNKEERNRYFNTKAQKNKEEKMTKENEQQQNQKEVEEDDHENTGYDVLPTKDDQNDEINSSYRSNRKKEDPRYDLFNMDSQIDFDGYQKEQEERRKTQLYYMHDKPVSFMDVNISTIEDNPSVKNHIIICGIHSSIQHFVMPLRARYLKEYQLQKIVIITGEPDEREGDQIDPVIWDTIARFQHIYLVNGSPLKQETLIKANINYADKVVILGHDSTIKSDCTDEMLDAESIYIYKAIKKCNKDVQILTELAYSSNIEFLQQMTRKDLDYKFSTLYAAGEVYISAIIDTLTCQSYFNPHIVTILQQILKGGNDEDDDEGKSFEYLFLYLLDKKQITLGLYRLKGATDNNYPYVYTNPKFDTLITHRDRAFVLGIDIPDDLQGDYYEMMEREGAAFQQVNNGPQGIGGGGQDQLNKSLKIENLQQRVPSIKTGLPGILKKDTLMGANKGINNTQQQSAAHIDDQDEAILGMRAAKNCNYQFLNKNIQQLNIEPTSVQQITKKLEQSIRLIENEVERLANQVQQQDLKIMKTVKEQTKEFIDSNKMNNNNQ